MPVTNSGSVAAIEIVGTIAPGLLGTPDGSDTSVVGKTGTPDGNVSGSETPTGRDGNVTLFVDDVVGIVGTSGGSVWEVSCCAEDGAVGNSGGETLCENSGTRPVDGVATLDSSSTSVVAAMEAPGMDGLVSCCCGNKVASTGFSVTAPGNGVSGNVSPTSGVTLGEYSGARGVVEPMVYHGTVSSANGVTRVVPGGTTVTPSSGKDALSLAEDSVVGIVSHGVSVVVGSFFSKAHLSVLPPRLKVHLKELLASLPSLKTTVA